MNSPRETEARLEAARLAVRERLQPESAAHSERTAATSRRLAQIHHVDPYSAELAGLLHDWSRDEPVAELPAIAESMGLPVLDEERAHPYLLHSRVGAERLRDEFPGIGEDVLRAVEVHTVGSAPMSDLDKIVYIADMVEPARLFPGVDRLRSAAETEPLAEAFREAYASSLREVLSKGRRLHPSALQVVGQIEQETGRGMPEGATMSK